MTMEYLTYHDLLIEEFERRKLVNSAYSLRAYARDLNMPAARLSQILNRKQGISVEVAQQLGKKLKFDDAKMQWFCDSVGSLHARKQNEKNEFKNKMAIYKKEAKTYTEIHLEYFKVISDWYHFAILELTYLSDFKNDPKWIAKKLGIEPSEAIDAINRMKNLELMREENGQLLDVFKFLATPNDTPSMSLKKFNTQLIKKAMDALYEQDISNREISSNIFAVSKNRLPDLKKRLREFRRELETEFGNDKKKDAVYCLGLQLYELTNTLEEQI